MLRVLLVEDSADLAANLIDYLAGRGHVVDWARNGLDGLQRALTGDAEVVVLDLGLPWMDGLELCRRLRAEGATLPVLILTSRDELDSKIAGFEAGADDYLVKPFSLNELQARVRALVRRRRGGMAAPVLCYGDLNFDTVSRIARIHGRTLSLSMHEAGVLEVLLNRFGRVVSKEQLVEQLYSYDREVSQNAIEVYVHRVRKKIVNSRLTLRTLYGRGYVLDYSETR